MHFQSIAEISEKIRTRALSPVEVTEHMLARIEADDAASRSYVTVTADYALEKAKAAEAELDKGLWRGPLHGVPIALKDIIFTDFAITTGGTQIHKDFVPPFSATVTRKLEMAGAITLGKLKTTEQAFADHHPSVEAPVNPWSSEHFSGVSSSGSGVATAVGLAYGTLGSDTGGSIRLPSACNGITGLKPTWGRVSRHGVFVLGDTFDHIGPMTRSAVDAAIMLSAIAGQDPNDPTALQAPVPDYLGQCNLPISGLRIGVPTAFATDDTDPEVAATWNATAKMLADLGAVLCPVDFPAWTDAVNSWMPLCSGETAWAHRETYPSRKDEYGQVLSDFIALGQSLTAKDIAGENLHREAFKGRMAALFGGIDLLLVPVFPTTVPTTKQWREVGLGFTKFLRYTIPADLWGNPTITFPAGFDKRGLPIAMQLYGPHLSEGVLCRAAAAFQRVTDWHLRHPLE